MLESALSEGAVREAVLRLGAVPLAATELASPPPCVLYVFHDGMKHRTAFSPVKYPLIPDCALLTGALSFGRLEAPRTVGVTQYFPVHGVSELTYGWLAEGGVSWSHGLVNRRSYDCNEGNLFLPPRDTDFLKYGAKLRTV